MRRNSSVDHIQVDHTQVAYSMHKAEVVSVQRWACFAVLIDAIKSPVVCERFSEFVNVFVHVVSKVTWWLGSLCLEPHLTFVRVVMDKW